MRGEFIGVWLETWREIWAEVAAHEVAPNDLFCELYRELAKARNLQLSVEALAEIIEDQVHSREAFEKTQADDLVGECALVSFFENAHPLLDDLGGDTLASHYFNLLAAFINKYSLRYDLRRPCTLCPTLPGVFASLIRDLREVASKDPNLESLMRGFEEAIRDLRYGCSDTRINTCISKQFMLVEALGAVCPGVTEKSLGKMCDQLGNWPHMTIKESLRKLYGFSSDYPGIRHGNLGKGVIRQLEMRDMVAMSILLAGFTPYLVDRFDADAVYRGK